MTEKKNTLRLNATEADHYLSGKGVNPQHFDSVGETLIYAEILRLHERLDSIENQANEMMSPDKMMELATGFLGGGFGG